MYIKPTRGGAILYSVNQHTYRVDKIQQHCNLLYYNRVLLGVLHVLTVGMVIACPVLCKLKAIGDPLPSRYFIIGSGK